MNVRPGIYAIVVRSPGTEANIGRVVYIENYVSPDELTARGFVATTPGPYWDVHRPAGLLMSQLSVRTGEKRVISRKRRPFGDGDLRPLVDMSPRIYQRDTRDKPRTHTVTVRLGQGLMGFPDAESFKVAINKAVKEAAEQIRRREIDRWVKNPKEGGSK